MRFQPKIIAEAFGAEFKLTEMHGITTNHLYRERIGCQSDSKRNTLLLPSPPALQFSPEPSSHLKILFTAQSVRVLLVSAQTRLSSSRTQNFLSCCCCNTSFARPAPTPPNDQSAEDDSGQRELVVPPPPSLPGCYNHLYH